MLVWDLDSHSTSLAVSSTASSGPGASTHLDPLHTLSGHSNTVEDVCWCPGSSFELASVGEQRRGCRVLRPTCWAGILISTSTAMPFISSPPLTFQSAGDDYSLLLWDTRRGGAPVLHVASVHGPQDVHCVAWSPHQQEMLVTGGRQARLAAARLARHAAAVWLPLVHALPVLLHVPPVSDDPSALCKAAATATARRPSRMSCAPGPALCAEADAAS